MGARAVRVGDRFGFWEAASAAFRVPSASPHRSGSWKYYVSCRCMACGKVTRDVQYDTLTSGRSTGCGCRRDHHQLIGRPLKHGMSDTPEHRAWAGMRSRCRNPKDASWPRYGGRGLRVCKRWEVFENFLADVGPRPPGHYLGRKDLGLGYTPTNAAWRARPSAADNLQQRMKNKGKTWTAKKKRASS